MRKFTLLFFAGFLSFHAIASDNQQLKLWLFGQQYSLVGSYTIKALPDQVFELTEDNKAGKKIVIAAALDELPGGWKSAKSKVWHNLFLNSTKGHYAFGGDYSSSKQMIEFQGYTLKEIELMWRERLHEPSVQAGHFKHVLHIGSQKLQFSSNLIWKVPAWYRDASLTVVLTSNLELCGIDSDFFLTYVIESNQDNQDNQVAESTQVQQICEKKLKIDSLALSKSIWLTVMSSGGAGDADWFEVID